MWIYIVVVMVMQPYTIVEPCQCSKPWCTAIKTRTEYRVHHPKKRVYFNHKPTIPRRQWVADTVVDGRAVKRLMEYQVVKCYDSMRVVINSYSNANAK